MKELRPRRAVQHRQVGHRWVKYEQTKIFYIGGSILINLYGSVSASVEVLQHVLPSGFMKVRYYGFMNPNCKVELETISSLIELSYGFRISRPEVQIEPREPIACSKCGGALKLRLIVLPGGIVIRPG